MDISPHLLRDDIRYLFKEAIGEENAKTLSGNDHFASLLEEAILATGKVYETTGYYSITTAQEAMFNLLQTAFKTIDKED